MSTSDFLASAGVSLLLIAFYLNLKKKMPTDSKWYSTLNLTGAALCGYSSYLVQFYPFVFLNAVWAIAALISLFKYVSRETIIK
ncbi:MAG TPA: hypothetical protein PLN99_03200 [Daejeonella sp.]|uniref:CBU_0592 family membrane protein n=1 Tax=Daejeonella sp. TaxID=2805397 RepID=UPI00268A5A2D|nr:hypothetical protein [Daejeonella sp.]MCF8451990.1 hypothetical protein [Pedobacter sp.]HQS06196.1 hypothetical protein [Daejeonella sp.]HQS50878.1 hypothetical protein [Daejeonella sp.]HQT22118.1 hypothetical protein [Daejeonella sp.]HQT57425.1 hypothetical protein [Daejeonella sp.]